MSTLNDLKELDDFQIFKRYIKSFILQDSDLQKIIYYPYKNPLIKDDLENPYDIFDSSTVMSSDEKGVHGVVLFRRKCDEILNSEVPIILISFESTTIGYSNILDKVYIVIRIITKGSTIQELENGLSRGNVIAELFDKYLNSSEISSIGKTTRKTFKSLNNINEENDGFIIIYKAQTLANRLLQQANS
jgi:hypothetical protein